MAHKYDDNPENSKVRPKIPEPYNPAARFNLPLPASFGIITNSPNISGSSMANSIIARVVAYREESERLDREHLLATIGRQGITPQSDTNIVEAINPRNLAEAINPKLTSYETELNYTNIRGAIDHTNSQVFDRSRGKLEEDPSSATPQQAPTKNTQRFVPVIAGLVAGATLALTSHLALAGANTAGASAIANNYHAAHNVAFNQFISSQLNPSIGASHAGHLNYNSQTAYLNDEKDHAAPWMTWGEHAALNHFTTTNEYDKTSVNHWQGYIYQTTPNS